MYWFYFVSKDKKCHVNSKAMKLISTSLKMLLIDNFIKYSIVIVSNDYRMMGKSDERPGISDKHRNVFPPAFQ